MKARSLDCRSWAALLCAALLLVHNQTRAAAAEASNSPPTISPIADQIGFLDRTKRVTVHINDLESSPPQLRVSAVSSNPTLLRDNGIQIVPGNGGERTLALSPLASQLGSTTVTLTLTDPEGASARASFVFTVLPEIPVSIPDPNLEAALRDAIFKPSRGISRPSSVSSGPR